MSFDQFRRLFVDQGKLEKQVAFLNEMASGSAKQTVITTSIEALQDGHSIVLGPDVISSFALASLPALRKQLADINQKIDCLNAVLKL